MFSGEAGLFAGAAFVTAGRMSLLELIVLGTVVSFLGNMMYYCLGMFCGIMERFSTQWSLFLSSRSGFCGDEKNDIDKIKANLLPNSPSLSSNCTHLRRRGEILIIISPEVLNFGFFIFL